MNTENLERTPFFPDEAFDNLPNFLKDCTMHFSDLRERDVVLLSCVAVLSSLFPKVKGKYHNNYSHANLFVFITAPPASLKGSMLYGRMLANEIQARHNKQNEVAKGKYETQLQLWKKAKKGNAQQTPPVKPRCPVLILPGNTTASAIYRKLHENDGVGIIVETEADTLATAIQNDFGNFSDLMRKVFHHEAVTMNRVTDDVFLEINNPRVSALLTGTPSQVPRLITSAEDGLFSRFSFYIYSRLLSWQDPTPCETCEDLSDFFQKKSLAVMNMKDEVEKKQRIFSLSGDQFSTLSKNFEAKVNEIRRFEGNGAASIVFRLGLIAFRIAMLFSILREFEKPEVSEVIKCTDQDLEATLSLTDVLFQHSLVLYSLLPKGSSGGIKARMLFEALPGEMFTRNQADEIGLSLDIKERTVGSYLNSFINEGLLSKPKFGVYQKVV